MSETRGRPRTKDPTTSPSGWVGPEVGFQKPKVYLKGTCNARARVWRPRASGVPRRARSREEVPWSTAVSSSSRAAPGVRRLTRGCTVAAPAAHRRLPVEPRRRAVPRARCGNSAIAQRRATRQLEGNQRQRSSLIGREVGGRRWPAPRTGDVVCYFFLGSLLELPQKLLAFHRRQERRSRRPGAPGQRSSLSKRRASVATKKIVRSERPATAL